MDTISSCVSLRVFLKLLNVRCFLPFPKTYLLHVISVPFFSSLIEIGKNIFFADFYPATMVGSAVIPLWRGEGIAWAL